MQPLTPLIHIPISVCVYCPITSFPIHIIYPNHICPNYFISHNIISPLISHTKCPSHCMCVSLKSQGGASGRGYVLQQYTALLLLHFSYTILYPNHFIKYRDHFISHIPLIQKSISFPKLQTHVHSTDHCILLSCYPFHLYIN